MSHAEQEREWIARLSRLGTTEREETLAALQASQPELASRLRHLLINHESPADTEKLSSDVELNTGDAELPEIEGYRFLQKIGSGGMGDIYLAEQVVPLRRRVAIKIIRPGMDSAEVIARFESERQALALMSHPNIARIIDAGTAPGARPYFVMEYVAGQPLMDYCDEHSLDIDARLRIFISICHAVQHAHQKGIIHRDLKPSNILVTEVDGEHTAKIIDFGIAKALHAPLTTRTLHTRIGNLVGTPQYMSPESASLSPSEVDTRTDVYSLGVLLYELLGGSVPFDFSGDMSYPEILGRIQEDPVPPLGIRLHAGESYSERIAARRGISVAALKRRLAGELRAITYMALAKEPWLRYQTADALAEDLRRHLDNEVVLASRRQRFYQLRKFIWRYRAGLAATLAGVIALSVFAINNLQHAEELARERDRAAREAATATEIADYMIEVFGQADPYTTAGDPVSLVNALESGVKQLETHMPLPSTARVRLQRSLSEIMTSLGRHDDARALAEASLQDARALFDANHPESLASQATLGRVLVQAYSPDDALAVLVDLELRQLALYGTDSEIVLRTRLNIASAYLRRNSYGDAVRILEPIREQVLQAWGPDAAPSLLFMNNLAMALYYSGQQDRAITILQDVIPQISRQFGEQHPHTLGLQFNLASWYLARDRIGEALELFRLVHAGRLAIFGEEHIETLRTKEAIGYVLVKQGMHEQGEEMMLSAWQGKVVAQGEDHPDTIDSRLRWLGIQKNVEADTWRREAGELFVFAEQALGTPNDVSAQLAMELLEAALIQKDDDQGQLWAANARRHGVPDSQMQLLPGYRRIEGSISR